MIKKIFILLSIVLLSGILFALTSAKAQEVSDNLISNPSVESVNTIGQPLDWIQGSWGQNTASFSYQNLGHSGSKSLQVNITNYSSGDAKWYFKPVAALPNTQYSFTDYYQSSVSTEVVAQIINPSGGESYLYLGTVSPSATWQQSNFVLTTPANTAKLSVFHLLLSVGSLQTDDFILQKVAPVTISNNVPNSSLEQSANGTTPLNWQKDRWGTNTAIFSYLNTGHTGNRSAKVQITKYTSGDAKWDYDAQPMKSGDYLLTDYYQANVTTSVVIMIIHQDNSISYMSLKNAPASLTWAKYSDSFTLPADTKQISVFHLLSTVGYLITDDYAVTPYQIQGFTRPLVSITFDDGWEDNITTALPVIKQYGFTSTYYLCTQYITTTASKQTIKTIANAGNEIGSHTLTHPHLPLVTSTQLNKELANSKSFLERIVGVGKVTSFATPYGEYNDKVMTAIKKYYKSHRSVDVGYNTKDNFDANNIRVQNMTNVTTIEEFTAWVNKAKQDKTWLVIVYHRIGANPTTYESTPQSFVSQMKVLFDSGVTVKTISGAISEISPQIK